MHKEVISVLRAYSDEANVRVNEMLSRYRQSPRQGRDWRQRS